MLILKLISSPGLFFMLKKVNYWTKLEPALQTYISFEGNYCSGMLNKCWTRTWSFTRLHCTEQFQCAFLSLFQLQKKIILFYIFIHEWNSLKLSWSVVLMSQWVKSLNMHVTVLCQHAIYNFMGVSYIQMFLISKIVKKELLLFI